MKLFWTGEHSEMERLLAKSSDLIEKICNNLKENPIDDNNLLDNEQLI